MFDKPLIDAIDKRIMAKLNSQVMINEGQIIAVPTNTPGLARVRIRNTPELQDASFDPDSSSIVAGRFCILAKSPFTTRYVILGVYARYGSIAGSPPTVLAPPGNIDSITGLYSLSIVHWDSTPLSAVAYHVQTSATGSENDAVDALVTHGSHYFHAGTSAFYFRIRSIDEGWRGSAWSNWTQVTPESSALAAYIQAQAHYNTVKKEGTPYTQRHGINLHEGTNVTITVADDVGNDETDITIAAAAASTFLGLADTPGSFSGEGTKLIAVNVGESALEFVPSSAATTFLGLTDTPSSFVSQAGKIPIVNVGESALEWIDPGTLGAAVAATDLTDGPGTYSGYGGRYFAVKATVDGFEFVNPTFLALSDSPGSYSGENGKLLAVNGAANGIEFVSALDSYTPTNSDDWPGGDPGDHSEAADDLAERTVGRFVYFEQGATPTSVEGTAGTNIVTLSPSDSNLLVNTNSLWDNTAPTELAVDRSGLYTLWLWAYIETDTANPLNNWFRFEIFSGAGDTILIRDTYIGSFFWVDLVAKHYFDATDISGGDGYFWIRMTNFSTEDSNVLFRLSWQKEGLADV